MTDLLRLTNLTVVGQREEDGTLILETRSKTPRVPRRCCLLHVLDKNGTKRQRYRDHPIQGQPTILEVLRQRFRCSECGATHYEDLIDIDADRRLTVRFRIYLENQAIQMPFSTVATLNGVHETLVRRIFQERADRDLRGYEPRLPRVLGMDEIYLHGRPRFVIGDVENKAMLDMQPSRRDADLRDYFDPLPGRERVEVVCQDMWRGYRTLTRAMFPKAVTVIDKYHVQRTANYGMEVVRKALYLGMPNKERVALKRRKAIFLTRWDEAKTETQDSLAKLLAAYPPLQTAYTLKEQFYDIYEAPDRASAEVAVTRWLGSVPSEFERPFKTSIDALKNWRPHILNHFEHRFTSGYVERLNGMIRAMDRGGTGYSYEVLRAKALLKHGKLVSAASLARKPGDPIRGLSSSWPVSFGIDLSTLQADLEAGTF